MENNQANLQLTAAQSDGRVISPVTIVFGLMMSLPFLVPYHHLPIPSFQSEWLAMLLGLVGMFSLILHKNVSVLEVPRIGVAPVLLMLVVLMQLTLGMFAYTASAMAVLLYLLWCALIAVAGRTLVMAVGMQSLTTQLAWCVLAGGLVNAFCGICQYLGISSAFGALISEPMPLSEFGIYGNLAQQNHFSTHIALSLASATYLCLSKRLAYRWYCGISLIFLMTLALSGSRSSLLHLALIIGLSMLLLYKKGHARGHKRAAWWAAGLYVLAIGLLFIASRYTSLIPQLERLFTMASAWGPRLYLWKYAFLMFMENPVLGVGFDSFAYHLIGQLHKSKEAMVWGIDQYAHNLGLQLLAVSGVCGFAALVGPGLLYVRRQFAQSYSAERCWIWSMLGVLLIHSTFEQPLYYAYFLGLCAFILGMSDLSGGRLKLGTITTACALMLLTLAVSFTLKTAHDYDNLEGYFYSERYFDPRNAARLAERREVVRNLRTYSIFAPISELVAPGDFVPSDALAAEKMELNHRVMKFAPTAEIEFRHAALLAEAGRPAEALQQLERAVRAYPLETAEYLHRFQLLAANDPAMYGRLAVHAHTLSKKN